MKRFLPLILLILSFQVYSQELTEMQKQIKSATVEKKGDYHVVFIESSKGTKKFGYYATVEVFKNGTSIGKFKGSTYPKPDPLEPKVPEDRKREHYTLLLGTNNIKTDYGLGSRYYTWTRGKRNKDTLPCLNVNDKKAIPALKVSSERYDEDMTEGEKYNYDFITKFFDDLGILDISSKYYYATAIQVHKGWYTTTGSEGCLTISPTDEKEFFALFKEGEKGTLEIIRS